MVALNWDTFQQLPGGEERNWESVCRACVQRNYAAFGSFRSYTQQPGVEFHLRIEQDGSALGSAGRWWGWQCRWWNVATGRQIGTVRRRKIKDALAKTARHLPDLTDWVLWTRRHLTPADQEWFYALDSPFKLHLWTADQLEDLLADSAAVLRSTYFGELIFTEALLREAHRASIAPVKERWLPEAHASIDVEEELLAMLGAPDRWTWLADEAQALELLVSEMRSDIGDADAIDSRVLIEGLATDLERLATQLRSVTTNVAAGRYQQARELLQTDPSPNSGARPVRAAAHRLRARKVPLALTVGGASGAYRRGVAALTDARSVLATNLVAIVGGPGRGKTHLSAQSTSECGVFIRGADLQARGSLDDLARRVPRLQVDRFEDLLEAMEAAGARMGRRLLIAIDGLNESEDPRDWHGLLAAVRVILERFSHVLVAVTVRPHRVDDVLPSEEEVVRFEITGFQPENVREAVRRYFEHYKIRPGRVPLPFHRFEHPLFLRMFCEATNPTREHKVGIEALPTSFVDVFERFLEAAVERITSRLPLYPLDVLKALDDVAIALWDRDTRVLPFDELRTLVGDAPRAWHDSLGRALAEEDVLFADLGEGAGSGTYSGVLFDAFAGFLIAQAVLRGHGKDQFIDWIQDPDTIEKLGGHDVARHPLAEDVLSALVGMVPRRINEQLWNYLQPPLRDRAVLETVDLEPRFLDGQTLAELRSVVARTSGPDLRALFTHLSALRGADGHPLSARFLDDLLRSLDPADRDLRWTEWVRTQTASVRRVVEATEQRWRTTDSLTASDALDARWVAWLLTSTVRPLRDQATRALYWYGRRSQEDLFFLALQSLDFNDPYVPERLLAACYGVGMAHQVHDAQFESALSDLLEGLRQRVLAPEPSSPTDHWLIRKYTRGLFALANQFYSAAIPAGVDPLRLAFAEAPQSPLLRVGEDHYEEAYQTLGMDFENYTVGWLVPGRGNYDMDHPEFKEVVAAVLSRVWQLGWRMQHFEEIDRPIGHTDWRREEREGKVERYGKKYGWIGYYEVAGRLEAQGALREDEFGTARLPDVDIDPSFPEPPPPAPIRMPAWVRATPKDDRRWMETAQIRVPSTLLRRQRLDNVRGPWVAVSGYLRAEAGSGRNVFGLLAGILVSPTDLPRLRIALETRSYPGNYFIPREPEDHYLYAGEMPWEDRFGRGVEEEGWQLYEGPIRLDDDESIAVEVLAHGFEWEGYHSELNQAGGATVPSARFSRASGLVGLPQSFDQVDARGRLATRTFGPPAGFERGRLLYLREDLLIDYMGQQGETLLWFAWGERNLARAADRNPPDWLVDIIRARKHVWRVVAPFAQGGTH